MSFDATEGDISDFFSGCEVTSVRIVEDKIERKPKGFGYAEFASLEGLKKALEFNNTQFQGRNIRVSVAEPRKKLTLLSNTDFIAYQFLILQKRIGLMLATLAIGIEKGRYRILGRNVEGQTEVALVLDVGVSIMPLKVVVSAAVVVHHSNKGMESCATSEIGIVRDHLLQLYRPVQLREALTESIGL